MKHYTATMILLITLITVLFSISGCAQSVSNNQIVRQEAAVTESQPIVEDEPHEETTEIPASTSKSISEPTSVPVITADDLDGTNPIVHNFFGAADYSEYTAGRSSFIEEVEYWDDGCGYMEITMSGKTYTYANISYDFYCDFINADSLGEFYNDFINGNSDYYVSGYEG